MHDENRNKQVNDPSHAQETLSRKGSTDTDSSNDRSVNKDIQPSRVGRFEVLETIGSGAFGHVYRAFDPNLDRHVALKVPRRDFVESSKEARRFLREARVVSKIRHPNICPVYDFGKFDGNLFIVMALIEGRPLDKVLKTTGAMPIHEALDLVAKIAKGLCVAHEHGIVHRDLKPANIIIDPKSTPVITDFGLAKQLNFQDTLVTQQGQIVGTPAYMSPEQVRGDIGTIDEKSDQYSLGVILFEVLCGKRPHQGTSTEVMGKVLLVEPDSLKSVQPNIPDELDQICKRAMAKRPSDRFASVAQFLDKIESVHSRLDEQGRLLEFPREVSIQVQKNDIGRPTVESKPVLGKWIKRMAAIGACILSVVLFSILVFQITNNGKIIIDIPEEVASRVDVHILQGGKVIKIVDLETSRSTQLRVGQYELELIGEDNELKITAPEISVVRGEVRLAKITYVPEKGTDDSVALSESPQAPKLVLEHEEKPGPSPNEMTADVDIRNTNSEPANNDSKSVPETKNLVAETPKKFPAPGSAVSFQPPGLSFGFSFTEISPLEGMDFSEATDVNDSLQVVGTSMESPDQKQKRGFLFESANSIPTKMFPTSPKSEALGINKHGDIVGFSYTSPRGNAHAFKLSDGELIDVGVFEGGTRSLANDINDQGEVTGWAWDKDRMGHAYLFRDGDLIDLGTLPGGAKSEGMAINNKSQVAGWSWATETGDSHAVIWTEGKPNDLGVLGTGIQSKCEDINSLGHAVGWSKTKPETENNGSTHAFLYKDGEMRDLGTLGGSKSSAEGINDSGHIVGWSRIVDDETTHAFLMVDGQMYDINPPGWTHSVANKISESGIIVGRGENSDGQKCGFVLVPDNIEHPSLSSSTIESNKKSPAQRIADSSNSTPDSATTAAKNGDMEKDDGEATSAVFEAGGTSYQVVQFDFEKKSFDHQRMIVDNKNRVFTNSHLPSNESPHRITHSIVFEDGVQHFLPTFDPTDRMSVGGINDSGEIVGSVAKDTELYFQAFMLAKDKRTPLKPLSTNNWCVARDINNHGTIAGFSGEVIGDVTRFRQAVIWRKGRVTSLGVLPRGNESTADAINDKGDVTGWASTLTGQLRAFLYSKGRMTDLGALPGKDNSAGMDINDSRQIVGSSWKRTQGFMQQRLAFLYDKEMIDLGTLGGLGSEALAINDDGQIVGWSHFKDGRTEKHAFLHHSNAMFDINPPGWFESTATHINESGTIVGKGTNQNRLSKGFLLIPVEAN